MIAGPCVVEDHGTMMTVAERLVSLGRSLGIAVCFKASFDKANRSRGEAPRGPGLAGGLEILARVKEASGLPILSDVHETEQAAVAAEVVDVLQVPAFLCRQTDLLKAAAQTGRAVNVKKGQFLAPWDVKNIAQKLTSFGCKKFCFTERGTTFGYNNLVADMRSLYWMREEGYPVIFDATHSVQRPGGGGDKTSGDGALAPVLARSAMAAGCDGIFMEVHENPARALSGLHPWPCGPDHLPPFSPPR